VASSRTARVGDQIRVEIAELLARVVQDPGIGFVTITGVRVTPDLQQARVYYTSLGDDQARKESRRALERACACAGCPSCTSSSMNRWNAAIASSRSFRS
jgi:ribosome-binding factor A